MESQTSSSAGLKPGDLVEFHRTGYNHWGVYVGGGFIVHLTSPDGSQANAGSASVMSVTGNFGAVVKKEKLDVVAGGDNWNIGNHLDEKYPPRPADVIVKKALGWVGQNVSYGPFGKNCEHFSNNLRYDKNESGQADTAKIVIGAAAGGIGIAAVGLAALAFGSQSSEDKTITTMKK